MYQVPVTHLGELGAVAGTWLLPGSTPAITVFSTVSQQLEDLFPISVSPSLHYSFVQIKEYIDIFKICGNLGLVKKPSG